MQPEILIKQQNSATQRLANRLQLSEKKAIAGADAYLYFTDDYLHIALKQSGIDFCVDFCSKQAAFRQQQNNRELLLRALGDAKSVCDLTCGFAKDTLVMAHKNINVTALEKNSIIFALTDNALQRLKISKPELAAKINIYNSDAVNWLAQNNKTFDAIYLDPMFPARKKSAQVKKAAQVLQFLNCNAEQTVWDLAVLLQYCKRVVVKRPKNAENLFTQKPCFSVKGSTCRFDGYLQPKS